jgi:hypothetical protein
MKKLKNPIYKAAVFMKDQEDCDYARDLCLKYELPVWKRSDAFDYSGRGTHLFCSGIKGELSFYVDSFCDDYIVENDLNVVSIEEFETLAQEMNPQSDDMDDILAKVRELNYKINKPNI